MRWYNHECCGAFGRVSNSTRELLGMLELESLSTYMLDTTSYLTVAALSGQLGHVAHCLIGSYRSKPRRRNTGQRPRSLALPIPQMSLL